MSQPPPPSPATDAAAAEGAGVRRAAHTRREQRRLLLFAAVMVGFGAVCWLGYPYVTPLTKQWLGRRHLPELRQHLKDENWQQAGALLQEARRWAPDDAEVLHASLEFNSLAGGDPRTTLSLIRQLQERGAATTEDLVLMGQMHARLGEIAKAREIYDQLPTAARQQQHGLELHADLLQAAGQMTEANQARREALSTADDAASLQKLAAMDLGSSDPGRRTAMRERLWESARAGSSPTALMAMDLLAHGRELTVPQLDELLRLVEAAAPAKATTRYETVRLGVMSAHLRLYPHLRSDLVDEEIMRWKNRPPVQTAPLLNWLAAEQEYARILRMLPAQTAARYTDLLPAYVDALRGTGQWQALKTLLTTGGIDPAFPPQKIRLWQAEMQSHLHAGPAQARQTLLRIYEEAGRGDDLAATLQAGTLAEKLNQWDLAEKCYDAIATKHASARQAMLGKIYQMADHQHDGPGMLQACTRLRVLQPESRPLLTQQLYLQFLLGIELELAQQQLQNDLLQASTPRTDHLHLLQALAAYRRGEPPQVWRFLTDVDKPEDLSPGLRSVYAALLKSAGGDAGKAFRLVERISPVLLLPEEKLFLMRAR